MKRMFILMPVLGLISGCVMAPSPQGGISSAAYVGDRGSMSLDEIVVSLPAIGDGARIRNLHIFLSAVINPVRPTTAHEYDARAIVQRAHTRIASDLVAAVASGKINPSAGLTDLRMQILGQAKITFDPIYAKWVHSGDLRVDLVLTSLFFTDGSVGKYPQSNRFW